MKPEYHCPPSLRSFSKLSFLAFSQVCKDRRCQNASLFELEKCVSRCNGHGVSYCLRPTAGSYDKHRFLSKTKCLPRG